MRSGQKNTVCTADPRIDDLVGLGDGLRTDRLAESDVLYFETFGTKWIVLDSLNASVDLLDKRGANYSDRPNFVLFEEWVIIIIIIICGNQCFIVSGLPC